MFPPDHRPGYRLLHETLRHIEPLSTVLDVLLEKHRQ